MRKEITTVAWPDAASVGAKRSQLAEDLEIDGDISSAGPIDILGMVTGTVRAPEIIVSADGHIAGTVTTLSLAVQGTIDGKILARSVSFAGSARVRADVFHELIIIEKGAQIEGRLKR